MVSCCSLCSVFYRFEKWSNNIKVYGYCRTKLVLDFRERTGPGPELVETLFKLMSGLERCRANLTSKRELDLTQSLMKHYSSECPDWNSAMLTLTCFRKLPLVSKLQCRSYIIFMPSKYRAATIITSTRTVSLSFLHVLAFLTNIDRSWVDWSEIFSPNVNPVLYFDNDMFPVQKVRLSLNIIYLCHMDNQKL